MKTPEKAQFDHYAHSYEALHRGSVRASGEEPEYFAAYKASYMAWQLKNLSVDPREILDFGCGIGGTLPHLAKYFPHAHLHGVDVSAESLAMAKESHPDVQFDVIEAASLPLPDHSIDVAVAACVFHHIPTIERLQWTRELQRVLRPGGYLFIFEHNPANPLTRKVVRDCPFDEDAILLPRKETQDHLRQSGFHGTDFKYIVFFPRILRILRPLERFLGDLPLGAQYVAWGRA